MRGGGLEEIWNIKLVQRKYRNHWDKYVHAEKTESKGGEMGLAGH